MSRYEFFQIFKSIFKQFFNHRIQVTRRYRVEVVKMTLPMKG